VATPATPQTFYVTQANGQVLAQWSISAGATSYQLQRSPDGVNFTNLAAPTATSFVDTTVALQTQYWYRVAAVATGTSPFTVPQSIIPTQTAQMSLAEIRLAAQQRADRVNSNFVTLPELNSYINQSYFELYDLLVTVYEDYYTTTPVQFFTDGVSFQYPLPNGILTFQNGLTNTNFVPPPFYKLMGVDLGLNTNSTQNGYVTIDKFQFIERNKYGYPNTSQAFYGLLNMKYRLFGTPSLNNTMIQFIPTPSANQVVRLWYIPKVQELLQDTDTLDGISGWTEYIITDVAIKILQKEESDVTVLAAQKLDLRKRINDSAINRDAGRPDKISDTRGNSSWGGWGQGGEGGWGGGWY